MIESFKIHCYVIDFDCHCCFFVLFCFSTTIYLGNLILRGKKKRNTPYILVVRTFQFIFRMTPGIFDHHYFDDDDDDSIATTDPFTISFYYYDYYMMMTISLAFFLFLFLFLQISVNNIMVMVMIMMMSVIKKKIYTEYF